MSLEIKFSKLSKEYIEGEISKNDYVAQTEKLFSNVPLSTKPNEYIDKISNYLEDRISTVDFQYWYIKAIKDEKGFIKEPIFSIVSNLFHELLKYSDLLDENELKNNPEFISENEVKKHARVTLERLISIDSEDNDKK